MEQLFGAIPKLLKVLGKNAEVEQAVVFAAWKRCAGGLLNERTEPLEFFENRLVVAVEDNMWRRHLEELSPQMLARINGQLGKGILKYIEFRVQPKTFENARQNDLSSKSFRAEEVPPAINLAAQSIADVGLRKAFLKAAAEYLAKQGRSE
jgi:hypothetical protein